jgi:hypothetical protein
VSKTVYFGLSVVVDTIVTCKIVNILRTILYRSTFFQILFLTNPWFFLVTFNHNLKYDCVECQEAKERKRNRKDDGHEDATDIEEEHTDDD